VYYQKRQLSLSFLLSAIRAFFLLLLLPLYFLRSIARSVGESGEGGTKRTNDGRQRGRSDILLGFPAPASISLYLMVYYVAMPDGLFLSLSISCSLPVSPSLKETSSTHARSYSSTLSSPSLLSSPLPPRCPHPTSLPLHRPKTGDSHDVAVTRSGSFCRVALVAASSAISFRRRLPVEGKGRRRTNKEEKRIRKKTSIPRTLVNYVYLSLSRHHPQFADPHRLADFHSPSHYCAPSSSPHDPHLLVAHSSSPQTREPTTRLSGPSCTKVNPSNQDQDQLFKLGLVFTSSISISFMLS
jgi:hypothetical protein